MVYTETVSVPIDSRNTLIRNRDGIKARLGVEMYFPRSGVRGAYQDMVLKGTTGSVPRARREVTEILGLWQEEFDAFKKRRRERKQAARKAVEVPDWPSVTNVKETRKVVSNNMFDVLGVDEVASSTPETTEVVGPKPTKPKAAKLQGWAAMAAKPAQIAAVRVVQAAPVVTKDRSPSPEPYEMRWPTMTDMTGVSWGDEDAWAD